MCGITGMLALRGEGRDARELMRNALRALRHRGPDAEGSWFDAASFVALGHTRLSILDLSDAGAQPMTSPGGRFVITFNGEIYNHLELRAELEQAGKAPRWRGHSDTETLLACVDVFGLDATLAKLVGMFAFGLWDTREKSLTLARDRFGEKPLYYGRCGDDLVFGSELKALRAHPRCPTAVSRDALGLLLRFNYIAPPFSIHEGLRKVVPGTYLTFTRGADEPVSKTYWSVAHAAVQAPRQQYASLTDLDAIDEFERRLEQSVRGQMISDVPLGAFLSGGYDSSMIVALMRRHSRHAVQTFTLGSSEASFDESAHARQIARHLGTEHHELVVSANDARDLIPRLPSVYDEPFADSSQLPTLLVSELAHRHVKVALTGDGADELLGGYGRYALGRSRAHGLFRLPAGLRRAAARGLDVLLGLRAVQQLSRRGPTAVLRRFPERADMLASVLGAETADEIGVQQACQWKHVEDVVVGAPRPTTLVDDASRWLIEPDPTMRLMLIDLVSYLPGDILAKVDRAAMSVSLETRVPFLDHRLAEFIFALPMHLKIRAGRGKWILHEALSRQVPRALTERPKMGFSVPVAQWLRGPLREWAEGLLSEERLRREGFFQPAPIRRKWAEHLSGAQNWHLHLWSVLMFQAWLDAAASEPVRRAS